MSTRPSEQQRLRRVHVHGPGTREALLGLLAQKVPSQPTEWGEGLQIIHLALTPCLLSLQNGISLHLTN
jgi:hypothetical protein